MTLRDLLLTVTMAALCGSYLLGHWLLARARARRLISRSPIARREFIELLQRPGCDERAVDIVLDAMGRALGVHAEHLRPTDSLDKTFALGLSTLFLDEFDELAFGYVNKELEAIGIERWKPAHQIATIGDMISSLSEHMRRSSPSSKERPGQVSPRQ